MRRVRSGGRYVYYQEYSESENTHDPDFEPTHPDSEAESVDLILAADPFYKKAKGLLQQVYRKIKQVKVDKETIKNNKQLIEKVK